MAAPVFRDDVPTLRGRTSGVSLKPEHYQRILDTRPRVGFFEVHAENYMGEGGPPHRYLCAIREQYALSIHGVGLSLGGHLPLDGAHLRRLKHLIDRYQPALFSEHLAWSTHASGFFNDLLPLPYTHESLRYVCDHIDQTQSFLQRPLLLENPATYVRFEESTYEETEFLHAIVARTGCGLLLDVNNVLVTCTNHGDDPYQHISRMPFGAIGEIHLAGHVREDDGDEVPLLIDTHDRAVDDAVWSLYAHAIRHMGHRPTLIEWDANVPSLEGLLHEAHLADAIAEAVAHETGDLPCRATA